MGKTNSPDPSDELTAMTPTTVIQPRAFIVGRSRLMPVDSIRNRALDRLYERREAVHQLIRDLEGYQKLREARLARSATALRAGRG
jgi:hypothetical protein